MTLRQEAEALADLATRLRGHDMPGLLFLLRGLAATLIRLATVVENDAPDAAALRPHLQRNGAPKKPPRKYVRRSMGNRDVSETLPASD